MMSSVVKMMNSVYSYSSGALDPEEAQVKFIAENGGFCAETDGTSAESNGVFNVFNSFNVFTDRRWRRLSLAACCCRSDLTMI